MNNTHEFIIDTLKSFVENIPSPYPSLHRGEGWMKGDEVLNVCSSNKLLPIMYKVLGDSHLEKEYKKSAIRSLLYEHEIKKIFNQFDAIGIRAILLRGLYLGTKIYRDPALRPFIDIDVLIEKHNIEKAKKALEELGYYYNPFLFPEEFFLEVHLHLVYFQPKHRISCEVHWAIDHPFSTYNIKMEEVFENATPVNLEGIQCFDIKPELRFILLLIHIQKHLPYLKYQYNGPNLLQQIIVDGELLHILDAYLFLKGYSGNFNWSLFIEKAIEWNVDGVMHSSLKTVEKIFKPSLPEELFTKILPPTQRPIERFLFKKVLSTVDSNRLISRITKKLIFTTKRLPDLYTWFFPDKKTIIRKYKSRPFIKGNKLAQKGNSILKKPTQQAMGHSQKGRDKPLPNGLILWYYIANFIQCSGKILQLLIYYIKLRSTKWVHPETTIKVE